MDDDWGHPHFRKPSNVVLRMHDSAFAEYPSLIMKDNAQVVGSRRTDKSGWTHQKLDNVGREPNTRHGTKQAETFWTDQKLIRTPHHFGKKNRGQLDQ